MLVSLELGAVVQTQSLALFVLLLSSLLFLLFMSSDLKACTLSTMSMDNYLYCSIMEYVQSYASEPFTYPVMQTTSKKEKHMECRLVEGIRCNVKIETEVERPIKQLFFLVVHIIKYSKFIC